MISRRAWQNEFRRIAIAIVVLAACGWFFDVLWVALGFTLATSAYCGWHLRQLYMLNRWLFLKQYRAVPPPMRGIWSLLSAPLERLLQRSRKRKKRLGKAIARFRQAADASPDGAIIVRDSNAIVWLNRAAMRLLGLRLPQDLNSPISHLLRTLDFVEYLEAGDFEQPLALLSPINESIHLLLHIVPFGSDHRLILVRDVTRLHRLEQVRRDFIANLSHELRTPLTVLFGYLESISDDPDAVARWGGPLAQMQQQSRLMHRIVEDLLQLSRLENDTGTAAKDIVDISLMVAEICTNAERLNFADRTIKIQVDENLQLLGDHSVLFSAFSNLVYNAVQYTAEDGHIRIEWKVVDTGAVFTVEDDGIGIAAHHLPRLTERFYRIDKARSRERGGTGLGLAIVKHAVAVHDGSLSIHSTIATGSRFECHFPAERIWHEPEPPIAQVGAEGNPGTSKNLNGMGV